MPSDASAIERYLSDCLRQQLFPSAVYLVARGERVLAAGASGNAVVSPEVIPASLTTIYDLASLTKPLVTALLTVQLAGSGLLDLNAPAAHYLGEFLQTGKGSITIEQLLTHSSGLPAWLPLSALSDRPASAVQTIALATLLSEPGSHVVYSDLGYIAMGVLLERATGRSLEELARERIFDPLGLSSTCFCPQPQLRSRIAATESGNAFEVEKAKEFGARLPAARTEMIWGDAHDGNAHFLNGVAGHAGLFSTAADVHKLARQFLPGSTFVNRNSLPLFTSSRTPGLEEERSIGWQLASSPGSSAGPSLSQSSFGHSGFTGTSLWIDPERDAIMVLLTNRVHPRVTGTNMNEVRRCFHTLAIGELFD